MNLVLFNQIKEQVLAEPELLSYAKTVVKAMELCLERISTGNAYTDND